ncbi:MAG: metal-dependent hydrolase [Candidatus Aminicenantia bacterium]
MPSPVGHSILSLTIAFVFTPKHKFNLKFLIFIFFLGILPDLDLFPILIMGITRGGAYHQLYTHNLFFTLLIGSSIYLLTKNKIWGLLSFGIVLLHLLADILVTDFKPPVGVPLFYPLWKKTFSLGLFPGITKESWHSLFSWANLKAVAIEIFVFLPLLIVSIISRKKRKFEKIIFL